MRGASQCTVEPHAGTATGAFAGAPLGATKRVSGAPNWGEPHAGAATGAFGENSYGAAERVSGAPKPGVETHAGAATGPFGGAH
eukprot:3609598-Pyramimonas_sp.AAC.1